MNVHQDLIERLVRQHGLIQKARDESRSSYHVPRPASSRKGVLSDVRIGAGGVVSGYVWLTSLPSKGEALLRRRPDLTRVGSCVRIQDIGPGELPGVVQEIVSYLSKK